MNYDRIILELMDRVSILENEVADIKASRISTVELFDAHATKSKSTYGIDYDFAPSNKKDTTQYLFKGRTYCKNRLVLAVVQAYFAEHPDISASELTLTFDRSLQGSLGVVRELGELKRSYLNYERRFFVLPNEVVRTSSGNCVVCSQWGISNINKFIKRAKQLGFKIEAI